jgi:hypothetical protein
MVADSFELWGPKRGRNGAYTLLYIAPDEPVQGWMNELVRFPPMYSEVGSGNIYSGWGFRIWVRVIRVHGLGTGYFAHSYFKVIAL